MSKTSKKYCFINSDKYLGFAILPDLMIQKLELLHFQDKVLLFENKKEAKKYSKKCNQSLNVTLNNAKIHQEEIKHNFKTILNYSKPIKNGVDWLKNNKNVELMNFNDEKTSQETIFVEDDNIENSETNSLSITHLTEDNQYKEYSDVVVYTDGSVSQEQRVLSNFVINDKTDETKIAKSIETTSSKKLIYSLRAEALAIVYSLEYLKHKYGSDFQKKDITIVCDSQELLSIIKSRKNNIKTMNEDELNKMFRLIDSFSSLKFRNIKGHNECYGNILADGLKYFV